MNRLSLATAASAAATILSLPAASAATSTVYWAGTDTVWTNTAAWSTDGGATTPNPAAVPGSGDLAVFNISTLNTTQTVNLNAAQAAAGLTFNSTGSTLIQAGGTAATLTLGADGITLASGAGPVTIGSLTAAQYVNIALATSQTWKNNSSSTFTFNSTVSTEQILFGNSNNVLTFDGSGNFQIGGSTGSNNSPITGTGTWIKNGSGTLTLTCNSTFSGSVIINSGTVLLMKNSGLGGSVTSLSTALNVNNGLIFGGGLTAVVGGLTGAGNLNLTSTGGAAVTIAVGRSSGTYAYSGTLSGAGNVTASGGGTQVLTGENTFTGKTIIGGGGILSVASLNSVTTDAGLGTTHLSSSNLGAPTTVANGTITLGSGGTAGTLKYTGTGEITDRVIDLGSNAGTGGTIDQSGTGLLKFVSNVTSTVSTVGVKSLTLLGTGTGEIAGSIGDTDTANGKFTAITKSGSGTWILSGNNTYTGTTAISGGTLVADTAGINGTNSTSTLVFNVGTLKARTSAGIVTNKNVVITNTAMFDTTNGNITLGGVISGTKPLMLATGSNTLALSGTNTYTGATIVNAGILKVDATGSINGTSGITLNGGELKYNSATALTKSITFNGGKISGTGAINTAVTVGAGATLSPGNSPGAQTFSSLTWGQGGSYVWEINSKTGTAGTDWDVINTGTLNIATLTSAPAGKFNLDITGLSGVGSAPDTTTSWTILNYGSLTGSFDASLFNLSTSGFDASWNGTWNVADTGSTLELTYTVPEPAMLALLALGGIGLLRRRQRV